MSWIVKHWPKSTIFLAVYVTILLFLFVFNENIYLFLIWIQVPIYWLHEFEEYILPGGFAEYFNENVLKSRQGEWPLSKKHSFWINIPIIYIAFPVSAILAGIIDISIGIWVAYFSILNALFHVKLRITQGYNPGFYISAILNIPIGLFTVIYFYINDAITIRSHIIGLIIAIILQGGLMVWGLKVLRGEVQQQQN